ncbi:MAG: cytochrome P450 [Acidimicrobiales bacterium]
MTTADSDVYYDPYDFEIDTDPYPVWRRLRDEQPLYYNDKYDFYALSRFADVERCIMDWPTYISSRGTILEIVKSGMTLPPGSIIFEDPPDHNLHRGLLSRVFTPRRMKAIEPKVREFCATSLDPLVGAKGFDFIRDLGALIPMWTIGMLLGIPEQDQAGIRDRADEGLRLKDGSMPDAEEQYGRDLAATDLESYIDWRVDHPSDDVMTELLQGEFEDENGESRKLSRAEVLGYVNLLAAAGNETTTRLIGWAGKILAENPDQRAELVEDPTLVPNAVEELLRYESPSPVQARYVTKDVEHHGQKIAAGSVVLLLNASGNRDERKFEDADRFDIHRKIDHHLAFGYGIHFCLGAALARMEGRISLDEVLKRFPTWDVDWENAVQARTSTVRGWETLPVILP